MTFDFGGALGGIGSFVGNQISSAINSKRAWKYAQRAMNYQDQLNRKYNQWSLENNPTFSRRGYTSAGYNPLLALGSQITSQNAGIGTSFMNSDSDAGDQAVNSAMNAMSLRANIKNVESQTKSNEATSALSAEQAKTEQSKRTNLEFQNAMLDVQKHLAAKDLSWYDRKAYMTLYNQFQQAENFKAQSAIGAMNAETQRQNMINNYNLGRYSNETGRMNAYSNSKNARTNSYNAETNRGKRSFSGFGFSASFTPRNYNQGGYFMN